MPPGTVRPKRFKLLTAGPAGRPLPERVEPVAAFRTVSLRGAVMASAIVIAVGIGIGIAVQVAVLGRSAKTWHP